MANAAACRRSRRTIANCIKVERCMKAGRVRTGRGIRSAAGRVVEDRVAPGQARQRVGDRRDRDHQLVAGGLGRGYVDAFGCPWLARFEQRTGVSGRRLVSF